jgi:Leucine-rich repeat (LRR) protein
MKLTLNNDEYHQWLLEGIPMNELLQEMVTELNMSNSNITTLALLKKLPNLKYLKCSGNKLINLNGIESLTKLET